MMGLYISGVTNSPTPKYTNPEFLKLRRAREATLIWFALLKVVMAVRTDNMYSAADLSLKE